MTIEKNDSQNRISSFKDEGEGRNLVIVFLGFLLIGIAVALLLFAGDLFGIDDDVNRQSASGPESTVLDRAGVLPAFDAEEAIGVEDLADSGDLEIGDKALDFALSDFNGQTVKLSDFRGRPVIVNFWATWCAPCRIEMPELQAAYEKYQDEGLVILALDQDEPLERGRSFFYQELDLTFIPLQDERSNVATSYTSFSVLPTTYFIDPEGIITAIHRGPLTMDQIEAYLAEMPVTVG